MVGAVGEMASVKRRKLWKTGEGGLCCSSSAIQTRLGPSSLLEERSRVPIVFVVSFVLWGLPPKRGEMAKVYRIDRHEKCFSSYHEYCLDESGERTSYVHLGDGYCGPTFSGQEHHQVDGNWIMMS